MIIPDKTYTIYNEILSADEVVSAMLAEGLLYNDSTAILTRNGKTAKVYIVKNGNLEVCHDFEDYYDAKDYYDIVI